MMRIATAHAYDQTIARLSERQRDLVQTQAHISSNKQILRASDDPVNAARAERADGGSDTGGVGSRTDCGG